MMKPIELEVYKNYEISLTLDKQFKVHREDFSGVFPTYLEAIKAIDKQVKIDNDRKKRKIKLEVITEGLNVSFITGIDMRKGQYNGIQNEPSSFGLFMPSVFPNVPIVKDLLEKRKALKSKLNELDKSLKDFEITKPNRGFFRSYWTKEDYQECIDELMKKHKEKSAAAKLAERTLDKINLAELEG